MASYNSVSKDINIAKEVGAPSELFITADYKKSMSKINRLLLGHNRYATKGKITKENAHPFKQSHIVGAHNGSLSWAGQAELEDTNNKFETDSEAIFWSMASRGFEETWKLLANPVYEQNAFALTWFDTTSNKFYMVRNKKRPLYYGYTEKQDAMFWSSELGALQWILFRNGMSAGGKDFKTYSVTEDTLYEWEIPQAHDAKVESPKMSTLETPEPLYKTYTSPFGNESSNVTHYHSYGHNSQNVFKFPEVPEKFRPPYKNDKGTVLGKKFVESLTDAGCLYCGTKGLEWGKFGYFPTFGASNITEYLCEECYGDSEIREMIRDCSNV